MDEFELWPFVISIIIFVITYAGIIVEHIHRTVVALSGAVAMLAFGIWFSFYNVEQAIAAIDFNTIALIFGMMLAVGIFSGTGFFEYLAIKVGKLARGRPWLLLIYLGLVTSLVSMVLDNVTTIIIMVPITLSIADILGIPALPFLLSEAMLSNIGGVATLIGDPPNVIIGSAAGFSFMDFLTHLAPIVLLAWCTAQGLLLLLFRRQLTAKPAHIDRMLAMDERRAIIDPLSTRRMLETLGLTILLFFIHDRIGFDPGLVALIGACFGLLWVRPNLEELLKNIHWDVVLFFMALFIVIGGLEAGGVLSMAGRGMVHLTTHGMFFAVLAVLWVGALASGLIDNIPFTIAMVPILKSLAVHGVSVAPLWWALALGVGFGGNLSPIGATANVFVMSASEKAGETLTFRDWVKSGSIVSIATCVVGSLALFAALELGLL